MKLLCQGFKFPQKCVAPRRGAWIETFIGFRPSLIRNRRAPQGRVD